MKTFNEKEEKLNSALKKLKNLKVLLSLLVLESIRIQDLYYVT